MHWRHVLHNNDAMLGVKTCRAARTLILLAERIGAHPSQSVCATRASSAVRHAGVLPSECMLGDGARGVPSFDPPTPRGAPFCDVICIWVYYLKICNQCLQLVVIKLVQLQNYNYPSLQLVG